MKNFRGAVPMMTMAQSAANRRNTHTHSLTYLHQHSFNYVVRSASSAITEFGIVFIFRYLSEGEQTGLPGEKNPTACPLNSITY